MPCLLYADAVGVLSNGEGLSCSAVLSLDHNALKDLDSLAVTLFDLVVYLYGITYMELGTLSFNCAASIFLIISFIV